jgi:exocyst complex component 4
MCAHLVDTYLVMLCTSRIQRMNLHGCAHMQLNVLVLQQNLKNVEDDARLRYSALYFDLFTAGPDAIVARAKEFGKGFGVELEGVFTLDVVRGLLGMVYEEQMGGENRESSVGARRALEGKWLEVSEFMY